MACLTSRLPGGPEGCGPHRPHSLPPSRPLSSPPGKRGGAVDAAALLLHGGRGPPASPVVSRAVEPHKGVQPRGERPPCLAIGAGGGGGAPRAAGPPHVMCLTRALWCQSRARAQAARVGRPPGKSGGPPHAQGEGDGRNWKKMANRSHHESHEQQPHYQRTGGRTPSPGGGVKKALADEKAHLQTALKARNRAFQR